uniref:tetratricopeptide repeat protein n=1 Tax=Cellulomonas flavigena TaxID=1711 RepID=UPI00065FA1E9
SAGRTEEAIALFEQVLVDRARILGEDHPGTLASRNNLAGAYASVGRLEEAIGLLESPLAECLRILGPDHPHTGIVREKLEAARRELKLQEKEPPTE